MARKLRLEYPGAMYHVMNRGDRREPIFRDDADRRRFVETLGEVCGRSEWQVHASCLMPNHFHLVVETPQPTLVAGMSVAGRRELERAMEARRAAELDATYQPIRRGWFFGDTALKKELLGRVSERLGSEHYGEERQESQVEKAERVVAEELRRRGWTEGTLRKRAKGDPAKVQIAVRLRRETLVTVAWIAARLQMGSVAHVNTRLYPWRKAQDS